MGGTHCRISQYHSQIDFPAPCWRGATFFKFILLLIIAAPVSVQAQVNDWISPISGNWDSEVNWSAGVPNASQSEVTITNAISKAVAIQPTTPVATPQSMTVQNLLLDGVAPDTNVLLLNFFGTATPLSVLNDFNIGANGHVLLLYSALSVSNALNLHGLFDQEGGQLIFTNSSADTMQIEGGQFNLTNGLVNGANLYLGGATNGYVYQDSGLVSLNWLGLGAKPSVPGSPGRGTYTLQSGWLIANVVELVGDNGFGTLTQNGGTNSATQINVGNGIYTKNGGGLFAGEIALEAPSGSLLAPPSAILNHAGGTASITNDLRLVGQGDRHNPHVATFNMSSGSISTPRIQMEETSVFNQSDGIVNVSGELFIDQGTGMGSSYYLSAGTLFTSATTLSSSWPENSALFQSGGTHIVTNTLWMNGSGMYELTGGSLSVSNIVLTGSLSYPPQFFVNGAPPLAVTNPAGISSSGGAIVIEDSTQQFGPLSMQADSGINLAGNSAVLRFADSHSNSWQSQLQGVVPQLLVYNWGGSTNGGGVDQLVFGSSSSGLTPGQVAQISFVNPSGFPSGTYPARILSNGEVVPMAQPMLGLQNNGTNLVISWPGNYLLQSATNIAGPYYDVTNASPFTVDVHQFPMEFFRLAR